MANKNLSTAKNAKNDEFYTQLNDIQAEVNAYIDYDPDVFRGKTVLLPCDDPEWSNFTRFFAQNFERFGLKKLISTSYAAASKKIPNAESRNRPLRGGATLGEANTPSEARAESRGVRRDGRARSPSAPQWYQPSLFEQESPQYDEEKTAVRGKIFVLDHDTNRNGRIDFEDLEWNYLEGDGDFRSEEVCKLRDEADIIITNPPFSLFREFLAWIVGGEKGNALTQRRRDAECAEGGKGCLAAKNAKCAKKFLIIGNMNAITYKEVFPLIMANKMWLGESIHSGDREFGVPKEYPLEAAGWRVDEKGNHFIRVKGVRWFTNLEHGRRHQPLRLMTTADNIKFSKHKEVRGVGYLTYDNYGAIEVPFTDAIPGDYDGVMGVPISFLDKYCPEQFEIVGITKTWFGAANKIYPEQIEVSKKGEQKHVTKLNDGATLRLESKPEGETYYLVYDVPYIQLYARILIRAKRPK